MLTEVEKLAERDVEAGILSRHVSWGPEGLKMSEEERAAYINQVMEQVAREHANVVSIPVNQLEAIADALHELTDFGQLSIDAWTRMDPEVRAIRREVSGIAGFPAIYAEQWLPHDLQATRRKARLAAMRGRNGINDEN